MDDGSSESKDNRASTSEPESSETSNNQPHSPYSFRALEPQDAEPGYQEAALVGWLREASADASHEPEPFVATLFDRFRRSTALSRVARVCLAGLVPHSNQLVVAATATDIRGGDLHMGAGYTCLVAPGGSLFSTLPATVRVCNDSLYVVDSFQQRRTPVQRTTQRLRGLGLRSSLCLALGKDGGLAGFLFLNARETHFFNQWHRAHSMLLAALAESGAGALAAAGYFQAVRAGAPPPHPASPFEREKFVAVLEETFRRCLTGRTVDVDVEAAPGLSFLCVQPQLAAILALVLAQPGVVGQKERTRVWFVFDRRGSEVHCNMILPVRAASDFIESAAQCVAALGDGFERFGMALAAAPRGFLVRLPYEPVHRDLAESWYSVDGG